MVQFHPSLEALVLQAWRDRWSELEWSINLKSSLADDMSEINKLCGTLESVFDQKTLKSFLKTNFSRKLFVSDIGLLLKQATLSEEPNKLMFGYLNYSIAAQVVSHSSLLEAVVLFKNFEKELCIETILETLALVRDRLKFVPLKILIK